MRPVLPALRLDKVGAEAARAEGERLIEAFDPVGFILFGGTAEEVAELTRRLDEAAGRALLYGADLERGAGQQFKGLTELPPLAALGAGGDADLAERLSEAHGATTAQEAASVGVRLLFAPVLDVNTAPDNPIIATRAFGAKTDLVERLGAAWIRGARSAGGLPVAKHFPGHGATREDSHLTLPVCDLDEPTWRRIHLPPFVAAIEAGAAGMMTAHVAFPRIAEAPDLPATLSRRFLTEILRDELGFDGVVVSDAFIMQGVRGARGEAESIARALAAGVDWILYPEDPGAVPEGEVRLPKPPRGGQKSQEAPEEAPRGEGLAERIAAAAVRPLGDMPPAPNDAPVFLVGEAELPFPATPGPPPPEGPAVVFVAAEPAAWKGRIEVDPAAREALARRAGPTWIVALGPDRLLDDFPRAHRVAAHGTHPALVAKARSILGLA